MEFATLVAAGWSSGINAYLTVLVLGLAGRLGWADTPLALQSNTVLLVAAVLFAVEFVVDKIPLADTGWDMLHTLVRPTVAGWVGATLAGARLGPAQGAALAATLALVAHLSKASTRLAINASPEPFTNIAASVGEDGLVAVIVGLALARPWLAAALTLVAMVAFAVVAVALLALARRGLRLVRRRLFGHRAPATG
jgi:hypothetical protein